MVRRHVSELPERLGSIRKIKTAWIKPEEFTKAALKLNAEGRATIQGLCPHCNGKFEKIVNSKRDIQKMNTCFKCGKKYMPIIDDDELYSEETQAIMRQFE